MPNASDAWGYDPIDGRPSVTNSPTPYSTFHELLENTPQFFEKVGTKNRAIWPSALSYKLHDLVVSNMPISGDGAVDITTLTQLHQQVFEQSIPDKLDLYRAYIKGTPFIVVFGRSQLGNNKTKTLTFNWIVVSKNHPHRGCSVVDSSLWIDESKYQEQLNTTDNSSVVSILHKFYEE